MDTPAHSKHPRTLLPLPTVMAQTGMCRSWLYAAAKDGRFPRPIKVGGSSRWDSHAVNAWVSEAIEGGRG